MSWRRSPSNVGLRAENAAAALEVMSRFAADPRWLVYLPPTMSPTETTEEPGLLEHPREAFRYFQKEGIARVVCQQKHMGSRAVVVVCRDETAAAKRFGIRDDGAGLIYTRTGRRFFDDPETETALLDHVRLAITRAGWWETFSSDWFVLDCELMPWSAKAQSLLVDQYAAVGSASTAALAETSKVLADAHARYLADGNTEIFPLLTRVVERREMVRGYVDAYRHYCWPVNDVSDLKLAPFHLLASEGKVHVDRDHLWHMATLAELATEGSPLMATRHRTVDTADEFSVADGIRWWEMLTSSGGEGMVVKPLDFAVRTRHGLVQPAVKCRGREYLRIIYGPEYTAPENLDRLRKRGVAFKRSLALREFALGIESLERFVRREPLRKVHEFVFAALAMESEPVDPRL